MEPSNIQALQALFDAARLAPGTAAQHDQLKAFALQLAKFIEVTEAEKAAQVPVPVTQASPEAPNVEPFPKG